MSEQDQLKAIRQRIDALDVDIQELIRQRAECAEDVARIKRAAGTLTDFYRPEREAEVLNMAIARNHGPLPNESVARVFREIMSACLALQEPLKIAFLGPEGTFTQAAAFKHFGHAIHTAPHATIDEIFRDVESGNSHFGVVPVENSTEGVITHTLDMLMGSPMKICGEVELRIHHNLLGPMREIGEIKRVLSHQQSLAQCRAWLDANLPGVERVAVSSNAEAARLAAKQEGVAAVASDMAATIYGLNTLTENIEDTPDNTTRFLVIGAESAAPSGQDKTSLVVSAANRPGALHRLLTPFASHDVSMTRIESRPSRRGMWDYVYFIDLEGHTDDEAVAAALLELQAESSMLKIIGSYPRAVL